jgi:hypothetical protein
MRQMQRTPIRDTQDIIAAHPTVGMTQNEAVHRLLSCDRGNVDGIYFRGTTRDNATFSGLGFRALEEFPPANQVKLAVIEVDDEKGRELVITLLNGVVSSVSLR